jgi:Tfp pilus assembly protein PilF
MRGEYKESISTLEAALTSAPEEDRARILNNLARSLAKTGAWARAFEAFRNASNPVTAYSNLGLLFLRDGQPVRAAACFRRAIEESPRYDAAANDNLARARSQMSEAERETERLRSSSASCP